MTQCLENVITALEPTSQKLAFSLSNRESNLAIWLHPIILLFVLYWKGQAQSDSENINFYAFCIGLKSGLWLGHCYTVFKSFAASARFSFMAVMYLAPPIFPSTLISFTFPAVEKHHHSMTLASPCLAEGLLVQADVKCWLSGTERSKDQFQSHLAWTPSVYLVIY